MAGEPVDPSIGYRLMNNPKLTNVLIIIPAYQEEDNILRVLEDIRVYLPGTDILVINDGSTDRTSTRARQAGVNVIDLPFNLGIGAAMQTGFRYAAAHRYTAAIQIDADYQHPAEEAPRLVKTLEDEKADLVIGSRFMAPTGYRGSWLRRLGNLIFQGANALIVGQRIVDNTSGFRAYSERAISILAQNYLGEYPEPESISYLDAQDCRLVEIPVKMRTRTAGFSSITPIKSIYYMVRVLISILSFKKRRRR
jgi:glycosyltransferase involved in cell wall biosynthesis